NVCNPIPGAVARHAVALAEWLPAVRRIDLLDRLVPALARLTGAAGVAALSERECAAFAARDWLLGRQLRAPAAGRARGLRPDGALLVDLGAATIAVREGHVELASRRPSPRPILATPCSSPSTSTTRKPKA